MSEQSWTIFYPPEVFEGSTLKQKDLYTAVVDLKKWLSWQGEVVPMPMTIAGRLCMEIRVAPRVVPEYGLYQSVLEFIKQLEAFMKGRFDLDMNSEKRRIHHLDENEMQYVGS
ncbi:MAG TPA: hypothetical protein VIM37_03100 [Candidatus Microsaccharimonas sp.]|jgi:hypothetical protein